MKGVIIHAVLLAAMLGFSYQTWTRDKTIRASTGDVAVWDGSASDLTAVEFETSKGDSGAATKSSQRTVRVEKKDGYWWGTETRTDQKPKPVNSDAGSNAPPPEMEASTTKREFPVGDSFRVLGSPTPMTLDDLVKEWASMHAVRSLGTPSDAQKKEYGLDTSDTSLAVIGKGKTHTLILGEKVSGSSERYALDPESGKAYILAGALIDPLESGETMLRPSSIHAFEATALDSVKVNAGGQSKTAIRVTTDQDGQATKTWGDGATKKPDQTLANFVDNLDHLVPQKYDATLKASDMTPVMSAEYMDAQGKRIGALALYKVERAGEMPEDGSVDPTVPPAPVMEYYIVTETTRVPAQVAKASAERVEQDVPTIFV
ncbi:MAG TPA: DUF4340 domain-containing protein, partial [Kofleriaceae bacterium]|nr:DUF4340 domain-containing protein [Kofleriaceae bacterium]